ncbi:hypothetical protein Tco_0298722 [Tanacetum coccineum]
MKASNSSKQAFGTPNSDQFLLELPLSRWGPFQQSSAEILARSADCSIGGIDIRSGTFDRSLGENGDLDGKIKLS